MDRIQVEQIRIAYDQIRKCSKEIPWLNGTMKWRINRQDTDSGPSDNITNLISPDN